MSPTHASLCPKCGRLSYNVQRTIALDAAGLRVRYVACKHCQTRRKIIIPLNHAPRQQSR